MRRDVTVEVFHDDCLAADKRASLPRGSDRAWREVFDHAGRYRVSVSLRYGPSETAEWIVERPRRDALDVVLVVDGIEVVPSQRRV